MKIDVSPRAMTMVLVMASFAVIGLWGHGQAVACDCKETLIEGCEAYFDQGGPPVPVTVFCVPDGSGDPLTAVRGFDGNVYDATIRVLLRDSVTGPCGGVPAEDIWLQVVPDAEQRVNACTYGMIADDGTDAAGITYFSEPFAAGGHSDPTVDVLQVCFAGLLFEGPGFDIQINSADINGDLVVDLTDIGLFAQDFYGDYHFRSDFVFDWTLNLSDIGRLTAAIGAGCE